MEESVTKEIQSLLEKAKKKLENAEFNFRNGYYNEAISSAYYAMFHSARAVLLTKGVSPKKHSGLIQMFGFHFIETGQIEKDYGRWLSQGKKDREDVDYDPQVSVEKVTAEMRLTQAKSL